MCHKSDKEEIPSVAHFYIQSMNMNMLLYAMIVWVRTLERIEKLRGFI